MAISYQMNVDGDLLCVTAEGFDESLEQVAQYGLAVISSAVEHQCARVLCDERALEYRLNTIDTYELAQTITNVAPKVARVVLVVNPQAASDATFFENVVVNRGLTLRVFTDIDAARDWVTG